MNLEYAPQDTVITDINLKLLYNQPLDAVGFGEIRPKTLGEIVELGYYKYLTYLNIFNINVSDLLKEDVEDVNVFDLFMLFGDEEFYSLALEAFTFFLDGESASVDRDNRRFLLKATQGEEVISKEINSTNFENISKIIKLQNYVVKIEDMFEDVENTAITVEAKKLRDRVKELKKVVDKAKKKNGKDDEDVDIFGIISTLSSKSNSLNELNIFDLSIFQIYTKFRRVEKIDQFDIGVQSLLVGGKGIKLKNYYGKL